jgi:hypothetical protein
MQTVRTCEHLLKTPKPSLQLECIMGQQLLLWNPHMTIYATTTARKLLCFMQSQYTAVHAGTRNMV